MCKKLHEALLLLSSFHSEKRPSGDESLVGLLGLLLLGVVVVVVVLCTSPRSPFRERFRLGRRRVRADGGRCQNGWDDEEEEEAPTAVVAPPKKATQAKNKEAPSSYGRDVGRPDRGEVATAKVIEADLKAAIELFGSEEDFKDFTDEFQPKNAKILKSWPRHR